MERHLTWQPIRRRMRRGSFAVPSSGGKPQSNWRRFATTVVTMALLASTLGFPSAEEAGAATAGRWGYQNEYIYEDPTLEDEQAPYTWWKPPAHIDRHGYGGNGFHFTLAIGNDGDDQLDNWAHWDFESVDGRYEVQAWIPADWATAHPQYLIWADKNGDSVYSNDEYVAGPWLNQQVVSGWQSLGEYDLSGRVRIEVRDTRSRDDTRVVGAVNARLAVDAIRLRSVTQASPPGRVDGVDYVVDNRETGAGRVVWNQVPGATSYEFSVTLATENVGLGTINEDHHNLSDQACCSRSFNVSAGWRITAVGMQVRAVNSAGPGPWSIELLQGITYPTPALGAVTGVSYRRSDGRITWQPVSGATAYDVVWNQPGESLSSSVALCSPSDDTRLGSRCALKITRVLHKDLTFRVRAKNQAGTQFGPWSSWERDSAETQAPAQAPGAVSGLGYQSGRIHWNTTARATAYDVEWRNGGAAVTQQQVTCTSACSLSISREPDKALRFRVRAKNSGGSGPWSAWTEVPSSQPPKPGQVTGVGYRDSQFGPLIYWSHLGSFDQYEIDAREREVDQIAVRSDIGCPADPCGYLFLEDGKTSDAFKTASAFRIRAVDGPRRGPWSAWTGVPSSQPPKPGQVTGVGYRDSQFGPLIYWSHLGSFDQYEIDAREREVDQDAVRSDIGCPADPCGYLFLEDGKTSDAFKTASAFRIRAVDGPRRGPWSAWTGVPSSQPPKPGQVTGVGYRDSQFGPLIYWSHLGSFDQYEIDAREREVDQDAVRSDIGCPADPCGYLFLEDGKTSDAFKTASAFRIRAVDGPRRGPWSAWTGVPSSQPPKPGQVTGVGYRDSQFGPLIYWSHLGSIDQYEIDAREAGQDKSDFRGDIGCVTSECGYLFQRDSVTTSAFKQASAFRIRAVKGDLRGPWSDWVTVKTEKKPAPRPGRPKITDLLEHGEPGIGTRFGRIFGGLNFFSSGDNVVVKWNRAAHAVKYRVEYRYRPLDTQTHDSLARTMEHVRDFDGQCSSSACSGSRTVGNDSQTTFKALANTSQERTNLLEFRVIGINRDGEWGDPSEWTALRFVEVRNALDNAPRKSNPSNPGLCRTLDTADDLLAYVSVLRAATHGVAKASLAAANSEINLIPDIQGVALNAIQMLNGCYANPVEALESIPLVGPVVKVTVGGFLGRLHSGYSNLANVDVHKDPGNNARPGGVIDQICRGFWIFTC